MRGRHLVFGTEVVLMSVCAREGGREGGRFVGFSGGGAVEGKGVEGFDAVSEKRMVWREGGGLVEMQS